MVRSGRFASTLGFVFSVTLALVLVSQRAIAQEAGFQAELSEMLGKLNAYPDLIIFNGKIAVMDDKLTMVQAMAVRDRRVLTLGTNEGIKDLAGPKTQIIDLKGRTVLPGLIDSHTHPHLWLMHHFGHDPEFWVDPQLKLTPVLSLAERTVVENMDKEEILKKVREVVMKRADELGPEKWILVNIPMKVGAIGAGRQEEYSPVTARRIVTTADLDRMAPENPVFLSRGYFSNITNSQAKRTMKEHLGREVEGLRVWYFVIYDIILGGRTSQVAVMLKKELEEIASFGVTTIGTHIEPLEVLKALNMMDRKGEMPARWAWVHRTGFSLAKDPVEYYKLLGDFAGQGSEYLWNMGVGEEGWDAIGNCTQTVAKNPRLRQQLERREPCARQKPGTVGYNAHLAAVKAGLRLANVHATEDGTIRYPL